MPSQVSPRDRERALSTMSRRDIQTGQILVLEKTVDDTTPIINAGADINSEHKNDINITEQTQTQRKKNNIKTRREYRNRINRVISFWRDSYPDYFQHGTRELNEEEKNDPVKFHFKNDRDIVYSGLNVGMVKSFLSVKKKKKVEADGTVILASSSDIKKYDDAIKWGSQMAGQPLPSSYYSEMGAFIQGYNREYRDAQMDGRTTKKNTTKAGVPPHVGIQEVYNLCLEIKSSVAELKNGIKDAVTEAINEKVTLEGGVNQSLLQSSLEDLKEEILRKIDCLGSGRSSEYEDLPPAVDGVRTPRPHEFTYNGSYWCIPESFSFPIGVTRLTGWRMWLTGSVHTVGRHRWKVKPYRKFRSKDLHSERLKYLLKNEWTPIFSKMMETPGLIIPDDDDVDEAFVLSSFELATEYLRRNFSYIFKSATAEKVDKYTLGTWSHKIIPSQVRKHGTAADVAKLPPPTEKGSAHKELPPAIDGVRTPRPYEFTYGGSYWCIPESFTFPAGITRLTGWRMWLKGSVHTVGRQKWKVKPHRMLNSRDLHSQQLKYSFKNEWTPIFSKMMETPGLDIPDNDEDVDEAFVLSSFELATDYIKSCCSYIFETATEEAVKKYKLSTWSHKIKPSEVRKHGTAADAAKLPPPGRKRQAGQPRTARKMLKTHQLNQPAWHMNEGAAWHVDEKVEASGEG
ncbi:hypothetical protein ACHAWF_016513 [Thalassiosira exigua]